MTNPLPELPDEILIDLLDGESVERVITEHPEYVSEIRAYVSLISDLQSTYAGVRPSPESFRNALSLTRGIDAIHARPRALWQIFVPLGAVALLALFFTLRTPLSRDGGSLPLASSPSSDTLSSASSPEVSPAPSLKQAAPESSARLMAPQGTAGSSVSSFSLPASDPLTDLFMQDASSESALVSGSSSLDTAALDIQSLHSFDTLYTDGEF
jgi:hypothetical protein